MAKEIKGIIELEIDELELKARLSFTPSEVEGEEWQKEKILKLLKQKGIVAGIDQQAIEAALSEIEQQGKPYIFIAARSIPPQLPKPANLHYEPLKIPEEIAGELKKVLPDGPPVVYSNTVEKEKIEVEPSIKIKGYVEAGGKIATIFPSQKGISGENIFGKEISADKEIPEGIFLSDNIRESATDIHSEVSGFFRGGDNWTELIPYKKHTFSISASEDGITCFINFDPGTANASLPTAELIFKECEELGLGRDALLTAGELKNILEEAIAGNSPLKQKSISSTLNAMIRIDIPPDKMKAELTLKKGRGEGRTLSLKEIGDVIRQKKFKGMDITQVKEVLLKFYHSEDLVLENFLIVAGKEPTQGEGGTIKWQTPFFDKKKTDELRKEFQADQDKAGEINSLEEFSLTSVTEMASVEERTKVAEIQAATAGEPGVDVFGTVIPGIKGKEPEIKYFENVHRIKNEILCDVRGILERGLEGDTVLLRARLRQDSEIRVSLEADRMKGFISLIPHEGSGTPIDSERVKEEIAKTGIIKGIDQEKVAAAVLQAKGGEIVQKLLIAQGLEPEHGEGGKLIFHIERASGSRVTIARDGRANYKKQDRITSVQKGALLAEILPTTATKDGWDVTGKEIPARENTPVSLEAGKNVKKEENSDGSVKFIAEESGELIRNGNVLEVLNVHTIEGNINLKTGNVKFSGSVLIKGSVLSGFTVVSGESIIVQETVQGSLLSAADDISVLQGVKGGDKAILRAKKNIEVNFAEQAHLLCSGDIQIQNSSLRCNIKCNGELTMESDKGHIIGGFVRVRKGLEARNIGSAMGIPTHIFFGQDYLVRDQIELEEKAIEKLKNAISRIDSDMKQLERSAFVDKGGLEKLRKEKLHHLQVIEKSSHHLFNLRERFEQHFPSEITVKGTIFPGTVLKSHGRTHKIANPQKEVIFYFNPKTGRIEEKPLKGKQ
ncbi:hypothetical protein ES708_10296 [subsurface metagenome]